VGGRPVGPVLVAVLVGLCGCVPPGAGPAGTPPAGDAVTDGVRFACSPRGAAGTVDAGVCLTQLAHARRARPHDPELVRLADAVGAQHAGRCLPQPPRTPDEAILGMRCLQSARTLVATPAYEANLHAAGRVAALRFAELAASADVRGRPHAVAALGLAAACFDPARTAAAQATWQAAAGLAPMRLELKVRERGQPVAPAEAHAMCEVVARRIGAAVACVAPGGQGVAASTTLEIELDHDAIDHQVAQRRLPVVGGGTDPADDLGEGSGTDWVQVWRVKLSEAEDDLKEAQRRCDRAYGAYGHDRDAMTATTECQIRDRAWQLRDMFKHNYEQAVRDQRKKAGSKAARTRPRPTPRAPSAAPTVLVQDHTWTGRWTARVRMHGGGWRVFTDTLVVTDREHAAQPAIGLDADPLAPPAAGWLDDAMLVAVVAELPRLLAADQAEGVGERGRCPVDGARWSGVWLECWTEHQLMVGGVPTREALVVEAAQARARAGVDTGYPLPQCL
jgi:hypothetical protein